MIYVAPSCSLGGQLQHKASFILVTHAYRHKIRLVTNLSFFLSKITDDTFAVLIKFIKFILQTLYLLKQENIHPWYQRKLIVIKTSVLLRHQYNLPNQKHEQIKYKCAECSHVTPCHVTMYIFFLLFLLIQK